MIKQSYSQRQHGIVEAIFEYLIELSNLQCSKEFREPVDVVKLNIPDYHIKIKHPMDLSTLRENFKNGNYKTLEEIKTDFSFIISNCKFYNALPPHLPPHPICQKADELDKAFRTRMQGLKKLMIQKNFDEKEELNVDKQRLIQIEQRKQQRKLPVDPNNILDNQPIFSRQNSIPLTPLMVPNLSTLKLKSEASIGSNNYSYNESPASQQLDSNKLTNNNNVSKFNFLNQNLEKVENMLNMYNSQINMGNLSLMRASSVVVESKSELKYGSQSSVDLSSLKLSVSNNSLLKKEPSRILTEEEKEQLAINLNQTEIQQAFVQIKQRKQRKIKKILAKFLRRLAQVLRVLRDQEMPDCEIISHFLLQFLDDYFIDVFVKELNAIQLILLEKEVIHFIKSKKNSIQEKFQKQIIEYLQIIERTIERALAYNLVVINDDLFRNVPRDQSAIANSGQPDDDEPVEQSSAIFINSGYERELKSFKQLVKDSLNKDGTKIKFNFSQIQQTAANQQQSNPDPAELQNTGNQIPYHYDTQDQKASPYAFGTNQAQNIVEEGEFQRPLPVNIPQIPSGQSQIASRPEQNIDDNKSTKIIISTKQASHNENELIMNRYLQRNRQIFSENYNISLQTLQLKRLQAEGNQNKREKLLENNESQILQEEQFKHQFSLNLEQIAKQPKQQSNIFDKFDPSAQEQQMIAKREEKEFKNFKDLVQGQFLYEDDDQNMIDEIETFQQFAKTQDLFDEEKESEQEMEHKKQSSIVLNIIEINFRNLKLLTPNLKSLSSSYKLNHFQSKQLPTNNQILSQSMIFSLRKYHLELEFVNIQTQTIETQEQMAEFVPGEFILVFEFENREVKEMGAWNEFLDKFDKFDEYLKWISQLAPQLEGLNRGDTSKLFKQFEMVRKLKSQYKKENTNLLLKATDIHQKINGQKQQNLLNIAIEIECLFPIQLELNEIKTRQILKEQKF